MPFLHISQQWYSAKSRDTHVPLTYNISFISNFFNRKYDSFLAIFEQWVLDSLLEHQDSRVISNRVYGHKTMWYRRATEASNHLYREHEIFLPIFEHWASDVMMAGAARILSSPSGDWGFIWRAHLSSFVWCALLDSLETEGGASSALTCSFIHTQLRRVSCFFDCLFILLVVHLK